MKNKEVKNLGDVIKHSDTEREEDVSKRIDGRLSELICGTILIDCIINIRYILGDISPVFDPDIIFVISTICLIFLLIRIAPAFFKRINQKTICVLLLIVIATILSFILFPENNHQFINTCRYFCVVCLPTILVLPLIKDYGILKNKLFIMSRIICLIGVVITITTWTKYTGKKETYDMELGYSLLLSLLIIMYKVYEKNNVLDIFLIISTILLIIMGGSRGPLIAITGFAIFLLVKKGITSKKILKTILIIGALLIAMFNISGILNVVEDVAQSLHINSRTVRLMDKGLGDDSGRGIIYGTTQNEIWSDPLEIRGINADYNLLGIYTHNIALELLYQFGVIIGVILIIILLYFIMITVVKSLKGNINANLSMIFMMSSIPCLLFSNSLWVKYEFWLWLTMVITMISIERRQRREKKIDE